MIISYDLYGLQIVILKSISNILVIKKIEDDVVAEAGRSSKDTYCTLGVVDKIPVSSQHSEIPCRL